MLTQKFRLPHSLSAPVRQTGYRLRSAHFQLVYIQNHTGHSRFLINVPKAIIKLAVNRNRLKRLVAEVIYLKLFDLPQTEKPGLSTQNTDQTQADLRLTEKFQFPHTDVLIDLKKPFNKKLQFGLIEQEVKFLLEKIIQH